MQKNLQKNERETELATPVERWGHYRRTEKNLQNRVCSNESIDEGVLLPNFRIRQSRERVSQKNDTFAARPVGCSIRNRQTHQVNNAIVPRVER